MNRMSIRVLLLAAALAAGVPAQQFQYQAGVVVGPTVWSESVEALDANGDGLLDVIFCNGNGFASAAGSLAPTLLINQGNNASGNPIFVDETSTRLPVGFSIQGKGITTCDVDNDGDEDVIFACGFQNQPRILINDGSGNFTDETTTRFPTINLNSFGVNSGDLDNDGDLDLVFTDSGASTFGGSGGTAKMFLNDGAGNFSNASAQLNAVNKVGAQMVNIVDIDNDFDLDVIIDGRGAGGTQLYINDGTANFTYQNTLPAGSNSVYETDWADLDNDGDVDGAYTSFSGFNEGTAQNNLNPSANLTFTGTTSTISGTNGNDDNECAFVDANNDGILDLLIASLSGGSEKLYQNAGTFAGGSFSFQAGAFTAGGDSTLDLTLGDFDGDGDIDVVTAQGESGNFLNKYYRNNGSADGLGPQVIAIEAPASALPASAVSGGLPVRAWVQDGSYDNGKIWCKATLHVTTSKAGVVNNSSLPMRYVGGGHFRAVVKPSTANGLVGMNISYSVEACDHAGNITMSAPVSFDLCGSENYGTPSAVNNLGITVTPPEPTLGVTATIDVTGGPANQTGVLAVSAARDDFPFVGGTVYVNPALAFPVNISSDGSGTASTSFTIPGIPGLVGFTADMQGLLFDPSQPQSWSMSVGLEVSICDYAGPPPTITSISPAAAAPGAIVTLGGTDFQSGLSITVGGTSVAPLSVTPTSASFVMPAGVGCDAALLLVNPDGQNTSATMNESPTVTNTIFGSGPAAGGATFIVTGTGFVANQMTVTIGGASPTILTSTNTTLVMSTPPGTAGSAQVVITAPSGCFATTTYTYL